MESAEAPPAGRPAGRRGDPALARGALAPGQKKAREEGRTLVFIDESAFYLLPAVVRTYAPRGKTPILRHKLTRDHLSAMSGITPDGGLYLMVQEQPFHSTEAVAFLEHLLEEIPGKLLVLWDGAPIHHSQEIHDFLAAGAAHRIHLERLPAYAPELNPDEGVWSYLKYAELRNLPCQDMPQLFSELRKATHRLRRKPGIIRSCFRQAALEV